MQGYEGIYSIEDHYIQLISNEIDRIICGKTYLYIIKGTI